MGSSKKAFRNAVVATLTSTLEQHGFARWKPLGRDDGPVLHYERRADSGRDLVDLQFDKHGAWQCFVNLARVRGEKVETMFEGEVATDIVTIAQLSERTRLKGNAFSGAFKSPLLLRIAGKAEQAGEVVGRQIANRMNLTEQWFKTQEPSERLQRYKL